MMTFLRVALSFAAIGALLWLFARAGRGRFGELLAGTVGKATADPLVVLDRRQLTRNSGVALLRAGSRHLLVGIGEGGVQLLTEGDDLVVEPPQDDADRSSPTTTTPVPHAAHPTHPLVNPERGASDVSPPGETRLVSGANGVLPDLQSARTCLPRASRPDPSRTSLVDALREKTVRRS